MVRNREEAAKAAESTTRNTPGMCQQVTRNWLLGESAGDRDFDGDADAVDGWKSEPANARHPGDRNPPRGVPVSWSGGKKGHGHRALSLGDGKIRTTDGKGEGVTATRDLEWVEEAWGLTYLGWSDTITGVLIPLPPVPKPDRIDNFRGTWPRYDLKILDRAHENGRKELGPILRKIRLAVRKLPVDKRPSRVKTFIRAFDGERELRMGLLNQAVKAGRGGVVKDVYDELRTLINSLPK